MFKNETDISLPMAVWLAADFYDYSNTPNEISATTLLKPIREIVLCAQHPQVMAAADIDISTQIASSIGTAIHMNVEAAWEKGIWQKGMKRLGYPKSIIERLVINPEPGKQLPANAIPVYLERRAKKEINGFIISGKFDFAIEGKLRDTKSTSTYSWIKGNRINDYILQGSIYRWLNQDIITNDRMAIDYIFLDWSAGMKMQQKVYPPNKIHKEDYDLLPINEIERLIVEKLNRIKEAMSFSQDLLPECTPEELWQDAPVWKYYKNPDKLSRSTKNFDNPHDAEQRKYDDGNVGVVKRVDSQAKACMYCNALPVCDQAKRLVFEGKLDI